jgi:ribosome recycling factor
MKNELYNNTQDKMNKAIAVFQKELSGLRTGRSSVNFLDPVVVEVYGDRMPLSQVSTISTPDSATITVQVWDKQLVKTVEKAISDANLGVNPSSDGQSIRISLPPLSEERRKELVKIAHKYAENTKIALRNVRRDGMDVLKKMEKDSAISKDEHHNFSDEIQKLTDEFIAKIDDLAKQKEKEIMKI